MRSTKPVDHQIPDAARTETADSKVKHCFAAQRREARHSGDLPVNHQVSSSMQIRNRTNTWKDMHGNVGERQQTSLPAPVAGSTVLGQFAYWPHEMQTMMVCFTGVNATSLQCLVASLVSTQHLCNVWLSRSLCSSSSNYC